jgi:sugar phosphate isomerase/epimerase
MTMPKFGVTANPRLNVFNEIKAIGERGFDFVEFSLEDPLITTKFFSKNKKQLSKSLNEYNLFATAHAPLFTLLVTDLEEIKTIWFKITKDYVKNLSAIGVQKMVFHTYHIRRKASLEFENKILLDFVKSFKEIVRFGKKYKMKILIENAVKIGYNDIKCFKYLINNVPNLGMCLDVAHAFIIGDMKNIRNYITTFGNKLEHIHMHDNHRNYDEHLPIGKGKINYPYVVKMLKKIGYDKTITFEIFTSKEDVVKSREKIKMLCQK